MWGITCGWHCRSRNVDLSLLCRERSIVPATSSPFIFSVPSRHEMKYLRLGTIGRVTSEIERDATELKFEHLVSGYHGGEGGIRSGCVLI